MTLEELLKKLEPQIQFLGNTMKILGMSKDDVKQELKLHVVEDFTKFTQEEHEKYREGWWFKRLKWFLINLSEKERKEPVNKAIRMERFQENEE